MLGTAAATVAASGAAAASGLGMSLFSYNRGNYAMDQKLHYQRFVAGHQLAIQQTNQYRQDISDLTDLTVNRMIKFTEIAGLVGSVITALYCPGRLGFNTAPPPSWLMGLMMVNLAGTYLFLGLTVWFALHAALRSNSAATHMLTRFVRIPVPSQKLLDRARKFLASYEEQPFREVFRVPFMRHQYGAAGEGGFNDNMEMDPEAEKRTRHGYDVPAWYRKEKAIDHNSTFESMMPYHARGTAPEHFEAYREIQNEWWPYDVYARVCIFLAFIHLIHCWTYHQIGHHLAETRSVFAAGCVVIPLFSLQQIILTMDLLPANGEFPLQHIGPFAQLFAYIAAAIEYQARYDQGVAIFGYICVYVAYVIHMVFTMQLWRLCSPDFTKPPEPAEAAAAAWWPSSWRLPSNFAHAVWLVAPPRHLDHGQVDLVGEMREASKGNEKLKSHGWPGSTIDPRDEKRRDVHRALGRHHESPAWFNVKWGLAALQLSWAVLILGFSIDIGNQGTTHPSLLSAPGLPNQGRDPRYRPAKPWYTSPSDVGTGGVEAGPISLENIKRRLAEIQEGPAETVLAAAAVKDISEKLHDLLPYLSHLAAGKPMATRAAKATMAAISSVESSAAGLSEQAAALRWPSMFEPRVLACGHSAAAVSGNVALALSHSGRGAFIRLAPTPASSDALPAFTLEGAAGLGHLVAASWDAHGLLAASSLGAIVDCPGSPVAGRWRCHRMNGEALPIASEGEPFLGSLALARVLGDNGQPASLLAAVSFPDEPTVMVFSKDVSGVGSWLLAGELRTHAPAVSSAFTENAAQLLLSSADGAVARMSMTDGSLAAVASAVDGYSDKEWQATCGLASGGIARLALSSGDTQEPTLYTR